MPELPEVEIVRQSLDKKIKQKKVKKVIVRNGNLRFKIPKGFKTYFENKKIKKIDRFSKYIILNLSDNILKVLLLIISPYEITFRPFLSIKLPLSIAEVLLSSFFLKLLKFFFDSIEISTFLNLYIFFFPDFGFLNLRKFCSKFLVNFIPSYYFFCRP